MKARLLSTIVICAIFLGLTGLVHQTVLAQQTSKSQDSENPQLPDEQGVPPLSEELKALGDIEDLDQCLDTCDTTYQECHIKCYRLGMDCSRSCMDEFRKCKSRCKEAWPD